MSKTTSKPKRRYGREKILLNSEGTNPVDNLNPFCPIVPDVEDLKILKSEQQIYLKYLTIIFAELKTWT